LDSWGHRVPPFFWGNKVRFQIGVVIISGVLAMAGAHADAQEPLSTSGTVISLSASGEVTHPNDEAKVILWIEEQDKEKALAASRVNQKMRQGMEIVTRQDPAAIYKTRGYYSHPIYPEARPAGSPARQVVAWRVGQYLEVTTPNLQGLPKLAAAVQGVLALNGLNFNLSTPTIKKLDEQRIGAAYTNLQQRIAIIAKTMGRNINEVLVEKVEFSDAALYTANRISPSASSMRAAAPAEHIQIEEPSFEPGETTLSIGITAQLRFK
jgi:predicted secreted protein